MLIKIRRRSEVKPSEITPESVYWNRRRFMQGIAGIGAGLALPSFTQAETVSSAVNPYSDIPQGRMPPEWFNAKRAGTQWRSVVPQDQERDAVAPFEAATQYNNFYEFGGSKEDPARYAHTLKPDPWHLVVDGEVNRGGRFALEDLLSPSQLEERIYRLRCVEAWSMVIPWLGVPLADVIRRADPTSKAKYVRFETLHDPQQMRAQDSAFGLIDWPYVEGLRLDEAMHPLAILAVGMYGRVLPNQNGAPIRLVVPWKYGFKSIKSIVRISLVETQPMNSWQKLQPSEYGFYANVNPQVEHPRWSQARERRLPNSLFSPNRIDTLMFNGYEEEVASLYQGMDLHRYY